MTVLSVPDMSCGHCKASIEKALAPITTRLEIDLPARTLRAEGADAQALIRALEAIGFPASVAA